ncbi:GAF domain-containing sensor histidine kinase [Alkalinema sp. FACHB-956]|uniref:GAF domain-containing sensor histidine kinase n=1 Tax=Alkalinema sp. FACHB-956 TaxID=2692768 RepID=UPI0016820089|nr:GAF domain-containing sensor histidine kinase [Alkalinema sp. FACHB-956]MBD2326031.1 GAF domain-containing sensor histidine kinase [Alkalinema sp. FACHB-956]
MVCPESRLYCRLDGMTAIARTQQRQLVLTELGLLEAETVPVFEEAVQTAANFVDAPICWLSVMETERERMKAAIGLSRLGLMNPLSIGREISLEESFGVYVTDSSQGLVVPETLHHPALSHSPLSQQYGIRAYLGVPLITSGGQCIGVLSVMDLRPRDFAQKDVEFLTLIARLSMSEYERIHCTQKSAALSASPAIPFPQHSPTSPLKFELLAQLTQELRTPLTSVMGMASVLTREIYGPLTGKQREYLDIIHHSGQYLLSLVKEILELSELDDRNHQLNLSSVDIEMLCQQAISTLEQAANRREQQIRLSVEPGNRIWMLDKEKIRQMLYHLMFSIIQSSNAGSIVRLHVSNKSNGLKLTIWVSHPCLGEGLPFSDFYSNGDSSSLQGSDAVEAGMFANGKTAVMNAPTKATRDDNNTSANLGLLLSRQLAEIHGGQLLIQGSSPGHRYVITLPRQTMPHLDAMNN